MDNQSTLDAYPNPRKDTRAKEAYKVYNVTKFGEHVLLYKNTRVGCTTSLGTESINRNEKFLMLVPTNAIAAKTVVEKIPGYSDRPNAKVVQVVSNKKCIKNQLRINLYPDLAKLPILPLAGTCKADKCEFYESCPVTEILRYPNCDGVVITYKKIMALMLAASSTPNSTAAEILDTLSTALNVVLDEIHYLQFGEQTKMAVYEDGPKFKGWSENVKEFHCIKANDFKYIRRVLNKFSDILEHNSTKNSVHEILGGAQDENHKKHHLNLTIENPTNGLFEQGEKEYSIIAALYNELIDLTARQAEFKVDINQIIKIFDMMTIVMSKLISVSGIIDNGIIRINLSARNDIEKRMIESFVMSMQKDKRIFLTSATICSYNYGQLFMGNEKPKTRFFGNNGDPMNNYEKMLILADTKRYQFKGKDSIYRKKYEIINNIKAIVDTYGIEDCKIITVNKKQSRMLNAILKEAGIGIHATFYKDANMMGVSAKERVMIAVGAAHKPAHAFDSLTKNTDESKVMGYESVHADSYQNWSRVKDEDGKVPSLVFALGCSFEECEAIVTWGENRKIIIEEGDNYTPKNIKIECSKYVSKSRVVKCSDIDDMLNTAKLHKKPIFTQKEETNTRDGIEENNLIPDTLTPKLSYSLINRIFDRLMYLKIKNSTITNARDFALKSLNLETLDSSDNWHFMSGIENIYPIQKFENKAEFKQSTDYPLSNGSILCHLVGCAGILGARQINKNNKINYVLFEFDSNDSSKVESDRIGLCNCLERFEIPYVLELYHNKFWRVWVFVKEVLAEVGKAFVNDIKNAVGIEAKVYPQQTSVNKSRLGDIIAVPLHGYKSKIMYNGELVHDFKDLDIGIVDISGYVKPGEIKKPGRKSNKVMAGLTEPCTEITA